MLYVINADWGGFSVPEEVEEVLDCGKYAVDYEGDVRKNPILIEWVRKHKGETDLTVVEIPAEATDWELDEYDGFEHIIAVVDGKIRHLYGEE